MKSPTFFLFLLSLTPSLYSAHQQLEHRYTRAQTCGAFIVSAGISLGIARQFPEAPFFSTTLGDFGTAFGIYALGRSLAAYNLNQKATKKNIGATCIYDIVTTVPDTAIPCIGRKIPWQKAVHWFTPHKPKAARWWVTIGILTATNGWHAYEDPLGPANAVKKHIEKAKEQTKLKQCITTLSTTKDETATITFSNRAFAELYVKKANDPLLTAIPITTPPENSSVTCKVTTKHAHKFFSNWEKNCEAKLINVQENLLATEIITNQIVSKTLAASGLLLPQLENMPLTRIALGYVGAQLLSYIREGIRTSLFPRPKITFPQYEPLLPSNEN